jgi:hypothetical protein
MKKYKRESNINNNLITDEMIDFFFERTNSHIEKVKYYGQLVNRLPINDISHFNHNIRIHDRSKFEYPEYKPYIILTWQKHLQQEGVNFKLSTEIKHDIILATEHHTKSNEHHPEYWTEEIENLINKNDRDGIPSKIINATKMPEYAIAEMVCDWMAMSEELNDDPYKWCEKVINKRWKFNQSQINLIFEILDSVWNK